MIKTENRPNNYKGNKVYGKSQNKDKIKPTDMFKGISTKRLIHQFNEYMIKVFCGKYEYLGKAKTLSNYLISIRKINPNLLAYGETLNYTKYFSMDGDGNILYHIGISSIFGDGEILTLSEIPIGYNKNSKIFLKGKYPIHNPRDL